jgi:3',5'-cyclic-AMP phosphodiesterase
MCYLRVKMQLVQLSDIHIGNFFKQQVFDTVVEEVNKLNPDVIIITGDLTDEGLFFQFEYARTQIKKFTCSNIIVLAGNHDYRHTGYLVFKKFFPSSKQQIYEFDDAVIMTLGTARPDRDEGEVGYRQNLWMENSLGKYNDNDNNNNKENKKKKKKIKIIAMHHHLIGIPDTGTDKIIIVDAGDTLRACLQSQVDLVICGHKHRPWLWNLGALQIAYAGTTSSERYRGFF